MYCAEQVSGTKTDLGGILSSNGQRFADVNISVDQGASKLGRRLESLYKGGHSTTTSRHTGVLCVVKARPLARTLVQLWMLCTPSATLLHTRLPCLQVFCAPGRSF